MSETRVVWPACRKRSSGGPSWNSSLGCISLMRLHARERERERERERSHTHRRAHTQTPHTRREEERGTDYGRGRGRDRDNTGAHLYARHGPNAFGLGWLGFETKQLN